MIHSSAIISSTAKLGQNVKVGPYCVIGENVTLGDDCVLHSHVVIEGRTQIGQRNEFFPFSSIGGKTQDLKYRGEPTYLEIGDDNVFREGCTIHRSTFDDVPTRIGNHNLFLANSHVAHDCQLKNHIILSGCAALAGHCQVDDYAIISGYTAVHQFVRIGKHVITGGCTKVVQDLPPFVIADGNPVALRAINQIGLQRHDFTSESITALKIAYRKLFLKKTQNLHVALEALKDHECMQNAHVQDMISFIESSQRGVTR